MTVKADDYAAMVDEVLADDTNPEAGPWEQRPKKRASATSRLVAMATGRPDPDFPEDPPEAGGRPELWHDEEPRAFATIPVAEHFENWPVSSTQFRMWIRYQLYQRELTRWARLFGPKIAHAVVKPPSSNSVKEACDHLEAHAILEGAEYTVHLRVAVHDGDLYIDRCDPEWSAIRVSRWSIAKTPPVRFRRARRMLPLPYPVPGSDISPSSKTS